jgi:hypothetical protein
MTNGMRLSTETDFSRSGYVLHGGFLEALSTHETPIRVQVCFGISYHLTDGAVLGALARVNLAAEHSTAW